jgi:nitroreductase
MDLLEIMQNRRSIRMYTGEAVSEEQLTRILQAGMLVPSGKSIRPWEFIVVQDKEMLKAMSDCRVAGSKMLATAECAIVVLGDAEKSDVWIEDCSLAMSNMHLMAASLGVGSCWIQGRLREAPGEQTTEEYLRRLLNFPENLKLEAILSLGMPKRHPGAHELEKLPMEKVHKETY